jgi:predicted metallopeptidase
MIEWTEASSEVLDIAQDLINKYHPVPKDARIGFIFRSEASKSQGKSVLAKASKIDAKTQALMESRGTVPLDFLVWIAEDQYAELSYDQRQALIDHELCHLTFGSSGWKLRAHDIEEFQSIIDRYGFWNSDLLGASVSFKRAMQLDLGLEVSETEPARGKVVAVQPEELPMVA